MPRVTEASPDPSEPANTLNCEGVAVANFSINASLLSSFDNSLGLMPNLFWNQLSVFPDLSAHAALSTLDAYSPTSDLNAFGAILIVPVYGCLSIALLASNSN